MKLNIDGITEIDDFYFTPRCDMMQIYIRDKNGFQGPYCDNSGRVEAESFQKQESEINKMFSRSPRSIEGHERSNRVRRGVKSMEELKETGFQGIFLMKLIWFLSKIIIPIDLPLVSNLLGNCSIPR